MTSYERFKWETRGKAIDENIVKGDKYRFTVLTERLIRMEYDKDGEFVDLASQTVFYRDFPKTEYSVIKKDGMVKIDTKFLTLEYITDAEFSSENLKISLKNSPFTVWSYGDKPSQLYGTRSTLDGVNGAAPLEDGFCSRDGYTVMDDSGRQLLSENGWFKNRKAGALDLYFFGYAHDYLDCIKDVYRLTGAPPLLPDYALGNWWSRYHAYTQEEYSALMERFEKENLPFTVSVVDMDWHVTKIPNATDEKFDTGWTGYSWNKELFPDYKAFLKFLHNHNLKTALNLHPAQGIGAHEDMYEQMAFACDIDPKTKKRVKFDVLNPDFMEKYFDILHHPYESDGVDFWWMDWQQGTDYWWVHDEDHPKNELETITPLWLLNHLHILDIMRNGKRPMFFSRYAGFGSHRYPVGFSGDTVVSWDSLDFQPYFTATASNVGYSWWSHDIGGHHEGYRDDELQIRWWQLGVFSPINRLHSTSNPFTGKEPWNLGAREEKIAGGLLRLRHKLFPYIYTMNYRNHTELEPLVQPMYYPYPEMEVAYEVKNQFLYGSELIVAPITEKCDATSFTAKTTAWLPQGVWFDAFNGFKYEGGQKLDIYRGLTQMPVFAKAGAIVPMLEKLEGNRLCGGKDMSVYVFPDADNNFRLYEDEGDGFEYQKGKYAVTEMSLKWLNNEAQFTIDAAKGDNSVIPEKRNWSVNFRGFKDAENIQVLVDGKVAEFEKSFDKKTATVCIRLSAVSVNSEIIVKIISDNSLVTDNANAGERIFDILLHSQMSYFDKTKIWDLIKTQKGINEFCKKDEYNVLKGALQEMIDVL